LVIYFLPRWYAIHSGRACGALYNSLVVSYWQYTFAQGKPKKFYGYGWVRGPVGFLKPFSV